MSQGTQVKVTLKDLGDVVLLDKGMSASSLVNMLRQRRNQQHESLRPTSDPSSAKSNGSRDEGKSKNMTLAIVSLEASDKEEDSNAEDSKHEDQINQGVSIGNGNANEPPNTVVEEVVVERKNKNDEESSKMFSCLKERPLWFLFLVMTINGLFSLACSALIIKIEKPAQDKRLQVREQLLAQIEGMENNIRKEIIDPDSNPDDVIAMIKDFTEAVEKTKKHPDELKWDLLNAQAFITSVQTTTGYGDIVPVTTEGKVFTLAYAILGIPVFMWYIVKLGGLFRLLTMYIFSNLTSCFCPRQEIHNEGQKMDSPDNNRRRSTFEIVMFKANSRIKEQFQYDKRFHPSVIGTILLVFSLSVAYFISYMEGYNYFNALYACFITYSTIGFGDIDIFRVSYRSSWLNLLIYGNFIHILGYMILSAWIASLLEKAGVRKF